MDLLAGFTEEVRSGVMLVLTVYNLIGRTKYKYIMKILTGQSLAKSMGNISRVSENPTWPPLDQRGCETLGHERDLWVGVVSEGVM